MTDKKQILIGIAQTIQLISQAFGFAPGIVAGQFISSSLFKCGGIDPTGKTEDELIRELEEKTVMRIQAMDEALGRLDDEVEGRKGN